MRTFCVLSRSVWWTRLVPTGPNETTPESSNTTRQPSYRHLFFQAKEDVGNNWQSFHHFLCMKKKSEKVKENVDSENDNLPETKVLGTSWDNRECCTVRVIGPCGQLGPSKWHRPPWPTSIDTIQYIVMERQVIWKIYRTYQKRKHTQKENQRIWKKKSRNGHHTTSLWLVSASRSWWLVPYIEHDIIGTRDKDRTRLTRVLLRPCWQWIRRSLTPPPQVTEHDCHGPTIHLDRSNSTQ